MQFEYDETGSTFYYFMLAFLLLVSTPATYFLWPFYKDKRAERRTVPCSCDLCVNKSAVIKEKRKNTFSRSLKFLALVLLWSGVAYFGYKAATTEVTHVEYDPFIILGIEKGSTTKQIKKAYKTASLIHHPDKGGDEETFVNINKAYQSLTDEQTRKNWEEHGNPDGPQAMQFGIALPSWMVHKNNSVWVLGVYVLVFMIILPCVVGSWWYKSIKYSADDILLNTTHLYFQLFSKSPLHNISKCIMIICASFEFEKSQNKEIKERPTDNEQLPTLMKECRQLHEKNKQWPLACAYSMKARTLFHSYLNRSDKLDFINYEDISLIIKKMPQLVGEALNICHQLIYISKRQRNIAAPNVTTFENLIKINAMAIQGLWDNSSPLLQLPHLTQDMVKYFSTKKSNIKTMLQFAQLSETARRSRLRMLTDEEYDNVMRVTWSMPYVDMEVKSEVLDDEHTMTISAGSIVTVTVSLSRQCLRDVVDISAVEEADVQMMIKDKEEEEPKKKSWQKVKKKSKVAPKKKKPVAKKKKAEVEESKDDNKENEDKNHEDDEAEEDGDDEKEDEEEKDVSDAESGSGSGSGSESDGEEELGEEEADEEEWKKLQQQITKNDMNSGPKESYPVHCPHFPVDKEEGWYVFIADRKTSELITAPKYVAGLKDSEDVILRFQAPEVLGHHKYNVILKSDCYINCEKESLLRLFVEKEMASKAVRQWEAISEESESESESEVSMSSDDEE